MEKLLLLFFFLGSFYFVFSQDTWVRMDSVNGPPRSSCTGFVLNGEGFVVGGLGVSSFKRKMYSYDVDQNDWDTEESLGGPNGDGLERGGAISFTIKGKAYVGLGQGNTVSYFSDLWEYNPTSKAWTQKADFIGSPRRQAVGFAIDSFGYVGTGQDQNGYTKDFYKYDAGSNTWSQLNDFNGTARKGAVGFAEGGQGYIATGDDGVYTHDFWMYHPLIDSWEQKPDFPGSPRSGAVGWGIFPSIFIACGYDNTFNYKKDVWEYNYFGNQWIQRADFIGSARTNATAFAIGEVGYVGLGYNGSFTDDFYAYTPILSAGEKVHPIHIKVYPNPTTDFIIVDGINLNQKGRLVIYNLKGAICYEADFNEDTNSIQLDCNFLLPGIYICEVSSASYSSRTKLIIQT